VAFAVLDVDGRVVSGGLTEDVAPGQPDGPVPFVLAADVPPGDYVIRVAAADAPMRVGVDEQSVRARLRPLGALRTSDVLISQLDASGGVERVGVSRMPAGVSGVAEIEAYSARGEMVQADIEIELRSVDGTVAATDSASLEVDGTGRRLSWKFTTGGLTPGDYQVRAWLREVPSESIEAALTVIAGPPMAGAVPAAPAALAAAQAPAAAPGGSAPPERSLARIDVSPLAEIRMLADQDLRAHETLHPSVIDFVLSELEAGTAALPAALAALVSEVRNNPGSAAPPPPSGGAASDRRLQEEVVRALVHLGRREPEPAMAALAGVARLSPGFRASLAMFGFAHAAAGRDSDAIGAWETSLATGMGKEGIYLALIDALLSRRATMNAQKYLDEARDIWPESPDLAGRAVLMAVIAQDASAVIRAVEELGREGTGDPWVVYRLAALWMLADAPDALEAFRSEATTYLESGGAHTESVSAWLAAVERTQ
jgi:hypothetical protein